MSKIMLLLFSLFLFSCGKPITLPVIDPAHPPLTYNVPASYYNKYKSQFDQVTTDIISMTGKRLVQFVPNNTDPGFTEMWQAYSAGQDWVLFKETKDEFTNVLDDHAGMAYIGSPSNPAGVIVLNFSISMNWNGSNFRQVLDHEVLHNLGFGHTFDSDHSIMNYDYTYGTSGITSLDRERLASAFPFNLEAVTVKDLEKIAAFDERTETEKYAYHLMENFGLSESRAQTISRHLISYRKINSQRSLTSIEKDVLSKEILGFGF